MPGPVSTTPPFGVQDALGVRAVAVITTNTRVKGAQGVVGTVLDQMIFPGPFPASMIGLWFIPNTRVAISGALTVGASSQGMTYTIFMGAPYALQPMFVSTPDKRISNT